MSCREIQRKFSQFFDDVLSGRKNQALLEHLSRCKRCKQAWDRFVQIVNSLRCLPREAPPYDISVDVMEKIIGMQYKQCWWERLFRRKDFVPLAATGALAIILVSFVYLGFRGNLFSTKTPRMRREKNLVSSTEMSVRSRPPSVLSEGHFATSAARTLAGSHTVLTLYVDDVSQAEKRISTLLTQMFLRSGYQNVVSQPPHKVLSQYRFKIPITHYDLFMRELTKIGKVSEERLSRKMGAYFIRPVRPKSRVDVEFSGTRKLEGGLSAARAKRKMGKGNWQMTPMIPVAVVVVSNGDRE